MTKENEAAASHIPLLSQVPFLQNAEEAELEHLAKGTLVRHYSRSEKITAQDDFGHSMYILVSGSVSLHATRNDGAKISFSTLTRTGEFFGEEALLGRGIRLVDAIAESDTVLLEVEQRKFALLARRTEGAIESLESTYHQRAVSIFIQMHPYLSMLPMEVATGLCRSATMSTFEKDELPCRQNDPATHVMLVADGVLKAVRSGSDGRLSVLAYFNSGEVVGAHDPAFRPYDLVALGKVELVSFPKQTFDQLEFSAPEVYARFGKDRMSRQGMMESAGKTIFGSAEALLQEGMEVESLLIIDLDRCVRCGNCVRACHTRHQYTRLDRRGPIFRRRKSLTSKEHEHLLIPSSCRHCRDPECMIGCPTGAIERHPNGEVEINGNCIGCDNCARKCPYGNITMRPIPESEQKDNIVKQAIKCNLCREYEYSNCVHECPRGALLRVNPMEHFDEVAMLLAADQDSEGVSSSSKRVIPKRASRPKTILVLSTLLLLLGSGTISTLYTLAPQPYLASSGLGLLFGIIAASCLFLALFLGARKRLSNHGLGRLEGWTQFHMVIGALGFVASLAHADFSVTGIATTALMLLFLLEVLTGITGQILYSQIPKILTNLEKHSKAKLIEDLYDERKQLKEGIQEIIFREPNSVKDLAKTLSKWAGSPRKRFRRKFDSQQHKEKLIANLQLPPPLLRHQSSIERLLSDYCVLADVKAQIKLHLALKRWLVVHLIIAAALTTFLLGHIATMVPIIW